MKMNRSTFPLMLVVVTACADTAPPPSTPTQTTMTPPASTPTPQILPVRPLPPACAAWGDVLFEIDHDPAPNATTHDSSIIVYASGAWQTTSTNAPRAIGCLTAFETEQFTRDVDDSAWTAVPNSGSSCGAVTLSRTIYKARDKVVWVAAGCSHDHLDDASAKHLTAAEQLVQKIVAEAAAAGYPTACPTDLMTLVGKSCPTEHAECGPGSKTGFSNVIICQRGVWTQVEVPPPAP